MASPWRRDRARVHQAEAMWINFKSRYNYWSEQSYPFAVKIATGKICAITGKTWGNQLNSEPQDYVVLPKQPWLDGYCVKKGVIRQFVAMPLGEGYTVEEQLTDAAQHGGLQIVAYPMKRERYEEMVANRQEVRRKVLFALRTTSMGLAPGGRMKQDIYDDPYGLDAWDQQHVSRCFVTLVNSAQWMAITGERPPTEPPTAAQYTKAGLSWFDYYGGDAEVVAGAENLKGTKSVVQIAKEKGDRPPENEALDIPHVIRLRSRKTNQVREYSTGEVMDS